MFRRQPILLVLALIVGSPAPSAAQSWAAPLYALPEDGTWVEFDWKASPEKAKPPSGVLRISSVGRKEVKGEPHRWVEIKLETKEGDRASRRVRKILVAEKAFARGKPLPECVTEAYEQRDGNLPERLPAPRVHDFLTMSLGKQDVVLKEVKAKAETESGLGKFSTRHVSAVGRREYLGWLTPEVPFGWAKFEIRERPEQGPVRVIFSAAAARTGTGAKKEVDESKAR